MSDADLFLAVGCDIGTNDEGTHIRFRFIDDVNQQRHVVMAKQNIPLLLAALQKEIVSGSVVPIDRGSLRIGADFQVQGYQCQRKEDGSAVLTVMINLPEQGRTVTLPIDFPAEDAKSLAGHLLGKTS